MPKTVTVTKGMITQEVVIPTSIHDYSFGAEESIDYVETTAPPPAAGNLTAEERRLLAAGRITWDTRKPFTPREAPRRQRRD